LLSKISNSIDTLAIASVDVFVNQRYYNSIKRKIIAIVDEELSKITELISRLISGEL